MNIKPLLLCSLVILYLTGTRLVAAQQTLPTTVTTQPGTSASTGESTEDAVINFPASFFQRYQPTTALDMVQQVPGFQLDDSGASRGFGGTAGNLLINDRRPSSKQDLPSVILTRIPAGIVERIELIRAHVRGIDLRGQSVMVNIILYDNTPAAIQWESFLRKRFHHGSITPSVSISLTDNWGDTGYNAGLTARRTAFGRLGVDEIFDGNDTLTENRFDRGDNRNNYFNVNLNASRWFGETYTQLNSIFLYEKRESNLTSNRVPVVTGTDPRVEVFDDVFEDPRFEIGFDAERSLLPDMQGKAILLFFRKDEDSSKSRRVVNSSGNQTLLKTGDGNLTSTEGIGRLEFDWSGMPAHAIQANIEAAYNSLDSSLQQTLDTGPGPVIETVPGANSRVREIRWDFLLKDTWSLGDLTLDYGMGAEISTIIQTGDAEQERNFFFLKPQGMLSYAPDQEQQSRFRIAREVSQLDLNDFVSGTVFQDDDLALGNPNIQPDTTWLAELSHEQRLGNSSVVSLRVFHHWISDVLDLLPLSPTFEAPGNIGNGRRWGMELESTIPLTWLGLTSAQLKFKARWQDSTVVDPVTGADRVLSSDQGEVIVYDIENKYAYTIDFRQDFETARVAWGWFLQERADRPVFKVNELLVYDDTHQLDLFIETTRWLGIKMRLSAENLFDLGLLRERTIFTGERGLSSVAFREVRDRTRGRQVVFTLSGTF